MSVKKIQDRVPGFRRLKLLAAVTGSFEHLEDGSDFRRLEPFVQSSTLIQRYGEIFVAVHN